MSNYRGSACYIFFFDETWKSKNICLDIPAFLLIFAAGFRLFLKNCSNYFRVVFSEKKPFGCWHTFSWLLNLTILAVYIHPWLLTSNSDGYCLNGDRTYIYTVGCLNGCTLAGRRVQRGRIYTSLARKGLDLQNIFRWITKRLNRNSVSNFLSLEIVWEVYHTVTPWNLIA